MALWRRKKKKKKKEKGKDAKTQAAPETSPQESQADTQPEPADAEPEAAPQQTAAAAEAAGPEPAPEARADDAEPAEPRDPDQEETAVPENGGQPGAPEEPAETDEPAEIKPAKKPGLLSRMAGRLGKTRDKIGGSIERISLGKKIDDEVLDELEEVLVTADLGVPTTLELIEGLRGKVRRKELDDAQALKKALQKGITGILTDVSEAPGREQTNPHVIMVVGVNGVGKTTTIGKLAHRFTGQGRKVLLAAADTFRAAAAEQLGVWAERAGAPLVRGRDGSDPSAVAFDAVEAAMARDRDMVIIDTAGRLHTQVNLMEELKKIYRVTGKKLPGAPHEVILVLDATTGQNAINQAKLFNQAVPLTGLALTKLDGTAKGGVVVAIAGEMKLPILFVGLGEQIEDLRPFDPEAFAEAIF